MEVYHEITFEDLKVGDKIAIPENGKSFTLLDDGSVGSVSTVKMYMVEAIKLSEDFVELSVFEDYKDSDIVVTWLYIRTGTVHRVQSKDIIKDVKRKTIKG